ncbi:Uncharacterized protein HZ326_30885 [Fusarium oxysporum f. sp. albedinis]|nr:Uncharacterized protein HZ326_30885 [Fusarium oxysporum f. sp. albedinis]
MNILIHVGRRTCRSSVDRYTTIVNFFLDNSAVNAYSEYFTTASQEAYRRCVQHDLLVMPNIPTFFFLIQRPSTAEFLLISVLMDNLS